MNERYKRVFFLGEDLYTESSPLLIAAGALLLDQQNGDVLAQLKLKNLDGRRVRAAKLRLYPGDAANRSLGAPVIFDYLDLDVPGDGVFGTQTPIPMPERSTRSFRAEVLEVIFADGTVWTAPEGPERATLPPVEQRPAAPVRPEPEGKAAAEEGKAGPETKAGKKKLLPILLGAAGLILALVLILVFLPGRGEKASDPKEENKPVTVVEETVTQKEEAKPEEAGEKPTAAPAEPAARTYRLGLGVVLSTDSSKSGNAQVDATVAAVVLDAEGRIVAAKIDVVQCKMDVSEGRIDFEKEFITKAEMGDNYGMRRYSPIEKEWYEQAANFEQYVMGKTVQEIEAIELREDGSHVVAVDEELYAGCTISIGEFKEAIVKACHDEQGMVFTAEPSFCLGLAVITKVDGTSRDAAEDEEGLVKMYSEYAVVVVDDEGVILAALTDATQPNISFDTEGEIGDVTFGGTKRELKEGYNMVKYSDASLEWYEQAWNFAVFCVGKTAGELRAAETRTEESGHVVFADKELYAGCSIDIRGMLEVVVKAADKAAF